jgi:tRNA nucleotidyltransferase/poly(A) polymerase
MLIGIKDIIIQEGSRMCQSKEEGGKRCKPSLAALQRAKLKKILNTLDAHDPQYKDIEKKLADLNAAAELYGPCVSNLDIPVPEGVQNLLEDINSNGFSPLLVGGTVRDAMIGGTAPKDFDIEVYGTDIDTLASTLRKSGYNVDEVGKSFGVLKVVTHGDTKDDIDISVPRKDSLVGAGHRGFEVEMDSSMSVEEASTRRDYTINAMTWDYRYGTMIDPHNGADDLKAGILRRVSDSFDEDPLRSLRGFQFAGRFGMDMDHETAEFCKNLRPRIKEIAQERIATEWEKFYHKAKYPSKSMKVLRDMGWNEHAPGLEKVNTEASSLGKSLDHARDVAVKEKLTGDQKVGLYSAIIIRDMDKKDSWNFTKTTVISDKLQKMPLTIKGIEVSESTDDYTFRRTAQEAAKNNVSLRDWVRYERLSVDSERATAVEKKAKELGIYDTDEKPFVMGRHVLAMTDRKPGPWMGKLIAEAEEKQFKGELRSEKSALDWVKSQL